MAVAHLPVPQEHYHLHPADRAHPPHKGERRWHLVRPLHRPQSGLRRLGAKQTMLPPRATCLDLSCDLCHTHALRVRARHKKSETVMGREAITCGFGVGSAKFSPGDRPKTRGEEFARIQTVLPGGADVLFWIMYLSSHREEAPFQRGADSATTLLYCWLGYILKGVERICEDALLLTCQSRAKCQRGGTVRRYTR
jgi:hypothetical protein